MNPRRGHKYQIHHSPLSQISPDGSVVIVHPGCDAALFSFPAFPQPDPTNPANKLYGTPACLALDACRALTNYAAKDGQDFFARDRAGTEPMEIHVDRIDLLRPGCYYYFLGPPATAAHAKYPIVKTLAALTFPHDLPRHWSRAATSASPATSLLVSVREPCRAAPNDSPFRVDVGAFVPPTEVDWFNANEMHRYTKEAGTGPSNDLANWTTLREDIRDIFYGHGFVFYPTGRGAHVVYFLDTAHLDYAAEYHRQRVDLHTEVADAFIYARFAYAMVSLPRCDDLFEGVPVGAAFKPARDKRVDQEVLAAGSPTPEWIELVREEFDPDFMQLCDMLLEQLGRPPVFAMYYGDLDGEGGTGEAARRAPA